MDGESAMGNIFLTSLGGSGENGRNCYLIGKEDGWILLDCGVKREIRDGQVGFYPSLTREIVSHIKMVFLSHCHEDHVAALPLLYELGYKGNVYAAKETALETPGFMKKWQDFVKKNNGVLPFRPEASEQVELVPIQMGKQKIEGISVETGRSGHVLGGIWYCVEIDGKKILYTGDMCLEPVSLGVDIPEGRFDAAIMNSAYAGKVMIQEEQYQRLLSSVKETLATGGRVLLPVPPKGRGIDILLYLGKMLSGEKIYTEQEVVSSMKKLAEKKQWIQSNMDTELPPNVHVIETPQQRKAAIEDKEPSVLITSDGMITTDISAAYLEAFKGSEKNKIIITGHAAAGTPGAGVLDDTYRREQDVLASGEKIVFKVHMDDEDILFLAEKTGVKDIVLFHSNASSTEKVKEALLSKGVKAVTIQYPERVDL